jgi:hypothetical protein
MGDLRRWRIGFFVCGAALAAAPAAEAQDGGSFGVGPRVTFQRGDSEVPDSSALRLLGGQLKLRLSPAITLELSADYDSSLNENVTERARTLPLQASMLFSPIRLAAVSPYALGGVGWFNHSVTQVTPASPQPTNTGIREMGYHGGIGVEVRAGSRIAIHGDYRYTRIRFGGDNSSDLMQPTQQPMQPAPPERALALIPRLTPLQESLKMSHQGSTLNWGLTFFF